MALQSGGTVFWHQTFQRHKKDFFAGFYFWGEFCVAHLAWNNSYLSLQNSWETQANHRHSPVPLLVYSLKSSGMWFLSPHFAAHHTHSTLLKLVFQRHTKTSQQIFKTAFHWTFVFLAPGQQLTKMNTSPWEDSVLASMTLRILPVFCHFCAPLAKGSCYPFPRQNLCSPRPVFSTPPLPGVLQSIFNASFFRTPVLYF